MSKSKDILQQSIDFNALFIKDLSEEGRVYWMERFVLYTHDELSEVLEELPFKHWKNNEDFEIDSEAILEELADVMIFTLGMVGIMGYDAADVIDMISYKNQKNIKRQEDGY